MTSAAAADSVRDYVALATLTSLTRIAGGGFSVTSYAVEADAPSNVVVSDWKGELMNISSHCVSFTNNRGWNNLNNGYFIDGKPHDIEVRAALMLYHRVRRECCPNIKSKRKRMEEVEGMRKKKRNKSDKSSSASALRIAESNPPYRDSRDEPDLKDDISFDIISDLGTRRKIDSIISLANLLAVELEREFTGNARTSQELIESIDDATCEEMHAETQRISFTDVRSDDSGIICILSLQRSKLLYSHGRVPCPNCIKWFKGSKGLWWHQLTAHGNQYSSAIEVAAAGAISLAIVPYQERNEIVIANTQKLVSERGGGDVCAFSLVKTGKFDEFKELVRARKCTPRTQLDRNGASLSHWAAGCGRLEFLIFLIEQCNCCPNQGQRGKKSFLGRTPLHWAARNGHMSVVEYLVSSCKVDVDARTSDGTTALCWASWQGHVDIMKYLCESGADIHSTNRFGCNALLWSAQGKLCSIEIMAWLVGSGLDFNLINTNGHSAFHKAAQRGNAVSVQWLANKFLSDLTTIQALIGPDNEGNCPSDLCGIEGHEILAAWISAKECHCILQLVRHATSVDDLLENYLSSIPTWLVQDLIGVLAYKSNVSKGFQTSWGPGCGVRRMSTNVLMHFASQPAAGKNRRAVMPANELNDID